MGPSNASMSHTPSSSVDAPRGGGVDAFGLTVNDHTNAPIATTEAKRKSKPPPESTSVCRSLRMRGGAGSEAVVTVSISSWDEAADAPRGGGDRC